MNKTIQKAIAVLCLIALILFFYSNRGHNPCEDRINYDNVNVNADIDLDALFAPPTSSELKNINKEWTNFDDSPETTTVIRDGFHSSFRHIWVIENIKDGASHYGAVLGPKKIDTLKKYPVLVWVNGLDQRNPSVELRNLKHIIQRFPNYYLVIPSFRGQALVVDNKRYCSDGFFGDAFDGATDDALSLLYSAKAKFNNLDLNRINVCGQSRGGTVAMLMGVRDSTLNAVVSMAGPSRFHNRDSYDRFGKQFKYQFLGERKPMAELRKKMIKASPVYFINNLNSKFYMLQGKNDKTVDVAHAREVIDKLEGQSNFEYLLTDEGHRMYQMDRVVKWLAEQNRK